VRLLIERRDPLGSLTRQPKEGTTMKKTLVLAAILALGIGSVSVVQSAFALNQNDNGATCCSGKGGGGSGPGNASDTNARPVGNNTCGGRHSC
jgi:hypothetical protein